MFQFPLPEIGTYRPDQQRDYDAATLRALLMARARGTYRPDQQRDYDENRKQRIARSDISKNL